MYRGKYNNLIKELVKESKNDLNNNLNDNFWKWFGNSKIVDENGNPLICYHGTNNKFNSFNKSINGHFGAGIYFTPNYSVGKSYGSKLKSVYLKMENPLWFNRDMPEELEKAVYFRNKELLKDYDGIIVGFPENGMDFVSEIIVFEPNQIKSIDNNGDWNPNSNNIYESFVKDYSENPILYYTSSESEAKQMISTLLTKNPVRGIYDLKHKIYIFGDAYNVIHADLIEKMKLYGKEHLSYPIVNKEIYEYLDKNCAMFKVIDETDYKSFSRSDGYKYAFIGKLDDNQYVIFRNNELAPSYYNAPDELKKMQQVPLFKNIQFKKYDIRGVGLNTKDQLPQRMVDNSSNIMEDYDYIDDIEVLLNPTKKEFNDLVKRNKWYRILLSNTGIAIWSADTPLLHHQVEEEYNVRNAKHLFAYNGNVYFQDYNFKENDGYTDDDKKWFIEQAKKLDNNSILKTYFPKIHMEQDTIDMFNNKKIIDETIAYAGSSSNYDKPSLTKVLSGEGNLAHGYGLYYAEDKSVAKHYAITSTANHQTFLKNIPISNTNKGVFYGKKQIFEKDNKALFNFIVGITQSKKDVYKENLKEWYKNTKDSLSYWKNNPEALEHIKKQLKMYEIQMKLLKYVTQKDGYVHTVQIPDEYYLLNENESLYHQSMYVQDCLFKMIDDKILTQPFLGKNNSYGKNTGKSLYKYLTEKYKSNKNASKILSHYGIKGITYIGDIDKKCYVIFNSRNVKVLDKEVHKLSENVSLNENKFSEIQENIKYILSSDAVLFSCDPSTYDFMLKCLKQGHKPEYFDFNFYKDRPKFIKLCRSLLSRFIGKKVTGTDENIKRRIASYDGQSISKEGIKTILNGYYGNIKVGI